MQLEQEVLRNLMCHPVCKVYYKIIFSSAAVLVAVDEVFDPDCLKVDERVDGHVARLDVRQVEGGARAHRVIGDLAEDAVEALLQGTPAPPSSPACGS